MYIFETIQQAARVVADLDYLYIEWLLNHFYPILFFLISLFTVPILMVGMMFAQSLYIFVTKFYKYVLTVSDFFNSTIAF